MMKDQSIGEILLLQEGINNFSSPQAAEKLLRLIGKKIASLS